MIRPATVPLAGGRWEPFIYTIAIEGVNFDDPSASTLEMHIRLYPDAPGAALVDLDMAISSAQGLSYTVDTSGLLPITTIQIRVNETTMEGLPTDTTELGNDAVLAYDMQVTRPGVHEKVRYFKGSFTVEAGVTQ